MKTTLIHPDKLPVMEAFYTIQGEGFHSGKAAYFIRLSGCDVGCVWCDVKDSWEVQDEQWQTIDNIVGNAASHPARIAVITGGEPCIYPLAGIISQLRQKDFKVHIETSGAYGMDTVADWICVSPKKFKNPLPEMLQRADELKVVIFNHSDFEWAEENASKTKPECKLYLQPEFEKANKMTPLIVEYVKQHPQWQISLQTHKYIGIP